MIDHDEILARLDRLETAVKKIYIHLDKLEKTAMIKPVSKIQQFINKVKK